MILLLVSSALGVRFGQPQGQTRQLGLTPAACLAKMRQLELENAQVGGMTSHVLQIAISVTSYVCVATLFS